MSPVATTRSEFFADIRFSEQVLAALLAALRARAASHPDNPGLVAFWPAVTEQRMAAACTELIRLGYPVEPAFVGDWNGAKTRDGWAMALGPLAHKEDTNFLT
jgi:hypothetical protein